MANTAHHGLCVFLVLLIIIIRGPFSFSSTRRDVLLKGKEIDRDETDADKMIYHGCASPSTFTVFQQRIYPSVLPNNELKITMMTINLAQSAKGWQNLVWVWFSKLFQTFFHFPWKIFLILKNRRKFSVEKLFDGFYLAVLVNLAVKLCIFDWKNWIWIEWVHRAEDEVPRTGTFRFRLQSYNQSINQSIIHSNVTECTGQFDSTDCAEPVFAFQKADSRKMWRLNGRYTAYYAASVVASLAFPHPRYLRRVFKTIPRKEERLVIFSRKRFSQPVFPDRHRGMMIISLARLFRLANILWDRGNGLVYHALSAPRKIIFLIENSFLSKKHFSQVVEQDHITFMWKCFSMETNMVQDGHESTMRAYWKRIGMVFLSHCEIFSAFGRSMRQILIDWLLDWTAQSSSSLRPSSGPRGISLAMKRG